MKIFFINPNLDSSPIPNIGLAYVMSSIERYHKVKLLDMGFHARRFEKYILDSLKQDKPDVIGFSVTSFSFHHALKIASLIRSQYPDIPLVYGGVHPTLLPEETLQNPLVDAICVGEGEDSFKEYLDKLQNNQEPKDVQGIWYKDKSNNIIRNPLRPFREDLDSLPFPNWDHWEIEKYMLNESFIGGLRILTSRGCPYSCTFCSNPAIRNAIPGKFYRLRSPENVIEEVKLNVKKYADKGFKRVAFGDATFGLDILHLKKLCSLYVKENLHKSLPWHCQTRADVVTKEWADTISKSGCCMVTLGIESGNDYIRRDVFKKEISDQEVVNAINNLRRNNIMFAINIIIGCHEETKESLKASLDVIKKSDPINTYISFYQPLPKTELGELTKGYVITSEEKLKKPWNTPRIAIKGMNVFELKVLMFKIRIEKILKFFVTGLKLKGTKFITTVAKYVFSIGGCRTMSFLNPYFEVDLEQRTLYPYILERWKKRFLSKIK